jgi:ribonuclease HII
MATTGRRSPIRTSVVRRKKPLRRVKRRLIGPSPPDPNPDTYATFFSRSGRARVPQGLQPQLDPSWREEAALWDRGHRFVAGVDEVGRGCLAGPVIAGAVVLPRGWYPEGLRDSKLLDPPERERLAAEIRTHALAWSVAAVENDVIDAINILQATLLASTLAVARLSIRADAVVLDAVYLSGLAAEQRALIDADRLSVSVAAASVVAKVYRDALMVGYEERFPGYGFASHKGYTCPEHRAAIDRLGVSPIHRRTFGVCVDAREAESYALWPEESG